VEEREPAGLELRELQAKLDDLLLSHNHTLEQAKADAAEERERPGQELRDLVTRTASSARQIVASARPFLCGHHLHFLL
jgi:hypothetical protein